MTHSGPQEGGASTQHVEPSRTPHTDHLLHDWAHAWRAAHPTRLRTTVPCTAEEVFPTLVACAEPFRGGNRVDSRSVTRLHTTAGRLTGPGPLLPTLQDAEPGSYARRVTAALDGDGWMLRTQNPFVSDYPRWASLKDHLTAVWQDVGWPSVPVAVELTIGHGYQRPHSAPPGHAQLTWVLSGSLQAEATGSGPDTGTSTRRLTVEAGQGLFVPAGYEVTEVYGSCCVFLRVSVSTDARSALTVVRDVLRAELAPVESRIDLPYLPHPHPTAPPAVEAHSPTAPTPERDEPATPGGERTVPRSAPVRRVGRSRAVDTAAPIAEIAGSARDRVTASDFTHALRRRWVTCRSAAGLEPAPLLRTGSDLDYQHRFQVRTAMVSLPDGQGDTLWSVNGHLLPVKGAAARQIAAALPAGSRSSAHEICRALGAGDEHPGVLRLLRTLHRLRALDMLDQNEQE